jgi:hypothetical protein
MKGGARVWREGRRRPPQNCIQERWEPPTMHDKVAHSAPLAQVRPLLLATQTKRPADKTRVHVRHADKSHPAQAVAALCQSTDAVTTAEHTLDTH